MTIKYLITIFLLSILSGCMTASVPDYFHGPTAHVYDSVITIDKTKAYFFMLTEVDGESVPNSKSRTRDMNFGNGFHMEAEAIGKLIPAGKVRVKLVGEVLHAAPILTLRGGNYSVIGEVDFYPVENAVYQVKGTLSKSRSSIWVETYPDGVVASDIIEKSSKK